MDSLRFIIALVICFLIIYFWGVLQPPHVPPAQPVPAPKVQEVRPEAVQQEAPKKEGQAAQKPAEALQPEKTGEVLVPGGKKGEILRLKLTSRGGISTIQLPDYSSRDQKGPEVLTQEVAGEPAFLGLWVESSSVPFQREKHSDIASWELSVPPQGGSAVLERELDGLSITKEIRTVEGRYHADVSIAFENKSGEERHFHYRLRGPGGLTTESPRQTGEDLSYFYSERGGEVLKAEVAPVGNIKKDQKYYWTSPNPGKIELIGSSNNYFASALVVADDATFSQFSLAFAEAVPDPEMVHRMALKEYGKPYEDLEKFQRDAVDEKAYRNVHTGFISKDKIGLKPGEKVVHRFVLFMGPRDPDILEKDTPFDLTSINYYGWWTPLVKGFLLVLKGLYFVLRSWGLAIVGLTFFVRLALHPLNRKQQASMMRYQKKIGAIKPQMDALKERYAANRVKMNQEMQKLMKDHGINPGQMMGGCLLIFLQLPVWYALYNSIQYSLDLRCQPFLWIKDLTLPDRLVPNLPFAIPFLGSDLNLLPFIYVALTIVQQKLQPKPTDPQMRQQMKMMTFMLVFFGFIFYSFPAGFLMYFIAGACFSMVESRIIKKILAREGLGPLANAAAVASGSSPSQSPIRSQALYPARKPGESKRKKKE